MADAHALGACGENRAGSNPASPTMPRAQRCRLGGNSVTPAFVQADAGRLASAASRMTGSGAE